MIDQITPCLAVVETGRKRGFANDRFLSGYTRQRCRVSRIAIVTKADATRSKVLMGVAAVLRAATLHAPGSARECAQDPGGREHQVYRQKSRCQNHHYGHYDNGRMSAVRSKGAFGAAGDFNTPKNDVPADHYPDSWYHSLKCLGGAV